jgi:Mn2+/Fe2+ NRAMP family transporter
MAVAVGVVGSICMPHNVFLHSALVQSRKVCGSTAWPMDPPHGWWIHLAEDFYFSYHTNHVSHHTNYISLITHANYVAIPFGDLHAAQRAPEHHFVF